jgi:hypothetical protein
VGVKVVGEFSGVCHSETFFTARKPGQRGGPEKALEVDYGIEFGTAESANKRDERNKCAGMEPGLAEKFTVKRNYFIQVRMVFEKGCKLGPDEPANFRIGKTFAQGRKGRQSQDYVTQ